MGAMSARIRSIPLCLLLALAVGCVPAPPPHGRPTAGDPQASAPAPRTAAPTPAGPTPIPSFVRPTPTPLPTFLVYEVRPGDTLEGIGDQFATTGRSIALWNLDRYPSLDPSSDAYRPDRIVVGWTLRLVPGLEFDSEDFGEPSTQPRPRQPTTEAPIGADPAADRGDRGRQRSRVSESPSLDDPLEELPGPGLARVAEDLLRRSLLEDHAAVQEADARGDLPGEGHLVGRDDHGHAAGGQFADDVEHLGDELGVERARDLVEEQQVGLHRQRPDDRHALLLAAGQPVRVLGDLVGQAEALQQGTASCSASARGVPRTRRGPSVTLSITACAGTD